jgi:urease accessory protein
MLRVERRTSQTPSPAPTDVLSLPYDARKKSRLLARSEKGREVAVVLARGSVLRDGDLLEADSGDVLLVRAAAEAVSDASSADALLLARAAYHLGNRHVPLQIQLGTLRYQHDHVLDAMLRVLGLQVTARTAAFEPEGGAYAGQIAHHEHADEHEHGTEDGQHSHQHGQRHRH